MQFGTKTCCSLALIAFGSKLPLSSFALVRSFAATSSAAATTTTASFSPSKFFHIQRASRLTTMSSAAAGDNSGSSSSSSSSGAATVDIADNLKFVREKIAATCESSNLPIDSVRLVAVSKTKPLELLKQAYNDASHRIFGENYIQELVEKAADMPNDVEWHFIGALQSNKANLLVKSVVPVSTKLTVETVSSIKVANKLNTAMTTLADEAAIPQDKKLHIFIQVNTSGEDSKSGIPPSEVLSLCKEITEQCHRLELQGLMTIGAPGDLECFDTLAACRDEVAKEMGLESLELSMGMSGDFEAAIERGATNVRVGSTIFGARDYTNQK